MVMNETWRRLELEHGSTPILDGERLEVLGPIPEWSMSDPPKPGEVWLRRVVTEREGSKNFRREVFIRAREVSVEEYETRKERQEAADKSRERAELARTVAHRWDLLGGLEALRAIPGYWEARGTHVDAADPLLSALSRAEKIWHAGRETVRGPEPIIQLLGEHGVHLAVDADGRLDSGATILSPADREVVERARSLLVAFLKGSPLRCASGKHRGQAPEAISLAWPDDKPLCADPACWEWS